MNYSLFSLKSNRNHMFRLSRHWVSRYRLDSADFRVPGFYVCSKKTEEFRHKECLLCVWCCPKCWCVPSVSYLCVCVSHLVVPNFATPWTVAHWAPLSMEFSRQEYWSGWLFPTPGDLPNPRIQLSSLASPALADGFFTS